MTLIPSHATSFVGRSRELADLRGLVRPGRVVTLTGSGGSGKTRLASEFCAILGDEAAWLDPSSPQAPASDSPLVVIDACDRIQGGSELARRLSRSAAVLATAREPLGITGESACNVSSLSLPNGGPPAEMLLAESVRLFLARTSERDPSFRPDDCNVAALASVCRRLAGIPLAIELAAARTESLGITEIDDALARHFVRLTGGARTALARERIVEACIGWTHDMLTEDERAVFLRLAVLPELFEQHHAESVCGATTRTRGGVHGLVRAGLLTRDRRGFRAPEPVRRCARTLVDEAARFAIVEAG